MGRRHRGWLVTWLASGATVVACSPSPQAEAPSFGPPDRLIVQLDDYDLGWNLDGFVFGPQATITAEGRVFAELNDFAFGGVTQQPTMTGVVDAGDLADLVAMSERLPRTPSVGIEMEDGRPTRLMVLDRSWDIWPDAPAEFWAVLDRLHEIVGSSATTPWTPERWIERVYPSKTCTVGPRTDAPDYVSAPVFPFAADRFPIGTLDCSSP
jgi:hypothetical protein